MVDDWTDEQWQIALDESRAAAARHPWGRFLRLFGDDVGAAPLTDEQVVARIADAEGLVTQLMAEQGRLVLELRQRRLATQRQHTPDGHDPDSCTSACCDPDGWVGLEVAQALGVTERQVENRLDTAERLARYRHVQAVVEDGLLQSWTVVKLLEHLDDLAAYLSAERLDTVEQVTLAWLTDRPRTVGQLNARMRRLLLLARSQAGLEAAERDARDRRVWVSPAGADGLATLVARIPEPDALAVRAVLAALAADPTGVGDERTVQQRRADLVTAMVTGVPARHGHAGDADLLVRGLGAVGVHVDVTIPADTLRGGPAPAEVPGYGPVPAWAARDLATAATSCRALVYHPDTGHLLGLSDLLGDLLGDRLPVRWLPGLPAATGYTHPPTMARLVRARDVTCRAPGCTRRASACDCDHVEPYPDGPTAAANTCCLCRRHHRLKTHAPDWHVHLDDTGRLTWTTPTGAALATDPYDYSAGLVSSGAGSDPPPF
jgi:hypothetical protein